MRRANKNLPLAFLAATLGTSVAAGFGLAAGKNLYKKNKNLLFGAAVILTMVACPFIGGRGLVRGYDRGLIATIFLTIIWNITLIIIGFGSALIVMFYARMFFEMPDDLVLPMIVLGSAVVVVISTGVGFIAGLTQRQRRLKAFAVSKDNVNYLKNIGFIETDETNITHYDPDGKPLRFLEAHNDRLIFMAVGRRGKRPFINLDADGRMIGYSGIA